MTKKIVIASGKGGVGKSMLSSSLAMLFNAGNKIVAVDCDVDAPNLKVWLNEIDKIDKKIPVITSARPEIDNEKCIKCGQCVDACQFSALELNEKIKLNPFLCEGCGACEAVCPAGAIKLKPVQNGEIEIIKTKYGFNLVSGQLFPGETGSGKIVTEVKEKAEDFDYDLMIIDSSPGTGCPLIASIQGVDFVVLITEPTPSGFNDLKRVMDVVSYFKIPFGLVINKWDINKELSDEIEKWAGNRLLGKISYDREIFKAIANLKPIIETNLVAKKEIKKIFDKLKLWLDQQNQEK
ncbi:MAG: P-loop NTPase [Candidatus Portnoybacteria bacterium]|nr:P-loop NTPase [Candidatus Portnoybacteria bacterium]